MKGLKGNPDRFKYFNTDVKDLPSKILCFIKMLTYKLHTLSRKFYKQSSAQEHTHTQIPARYISVLRTATLYLAFDKKKPKA